MTEPLQTPARTSPRNGLGIAALVLGILALITSVSLVGLLFGSLAVALGLSAWDTVVRNEATNRKTTITAIVLGVVASVIALIALAFRIWLIF
jgi:tetrahydromethanopterin S-methyltransferase subunit E